MSEKVVLRILRQDSPAEPETRRFEEFAVKAAPGDSIASALFALRASPVTLDGQRVAPVAFESACRGDRCGACTLLVNGHVRSACRTSLLGARPKRGPVVLEPLSKLPLVRDLIVDKSPLRAARQRLGAWLEEPTEEAHAPFALAVIDRCSECGACFEACPETSRDGFAGAAALNEVRLLNALGAGAARASARLDAVMGPGGIADCGKARVCVEVCPEGIPLFDSILGLERDATRRWLGTLSGRRAPAAARPGRK